MVDRIKTQVCVSQSELFIKLGKLQETRLVLAGCLAKFLLGKDYPAFQFCWCYSGNSPINVTI